MLINIFVYTIIYLRRKMCVLVVFFILKLLFMENFDTSLYKRWAYLEVFND